MKVVQADRELMHDILVRISKKSKYISAFSSIMFSSQASYDKGWIRVALAEDGTVLGFTCVRHKVRSPETMLYFIMVDPDQEHKGVGQLLMADLEEQTPHDRITLKVEKDNTRAIKFYETLGYHTIDEAYNGKGIVMTKGLADASKGRKAGRKV